MEKQCQCITTKHQRCKFKVSKKRGTDHRFCARHQDCENSVKLPKSPKAKSPKKGQLKRLVRKLPKIVEKDEIYLEELEPTGQCMCITAKGNRCQLEVSLKKGNDNRFCWRHQNCENIVKLNHMVIID